MEYRYDAFISYNHNPRDMKIARIVQHELEHFKIPKEIAERTCCHRIDSLTIVFGSVALKRPYISF